MSRLIEGYWDCKYCDNQKIRGSLRECPNCGKPRDEDTIFYLSGKPNYISDKKASTINRKPDWLCNYCGSLNSDNDLSCRSCAAPRTSENLDYFENKKKQQKEHIYEDKDSSYNDSESDFYESYSYLNEEPTTKKCFSLNKGFLRYLFIGLLSLLAVTGLVYLFIPKTKEITIEQMSWERSIEIQRYQTVEESDWYLPDDARLLYSQQEFSHYEQVLDHYETKTREVAEERITGYEEYVVDYEDLGNGYFEEITSTRPIYETFYKTETYEEPVYRDEPVYRTKYYYEIDKWLYERTEKSSGFDKAPYWSEVSLADDERISNKIEIYYIDGIDQDGKSQHYSISYDEWCSIDIGQKLNFKVSVLGNATLVE